MNRLLPEYLLRRLYGLIIARLDGHRLRDKKYARQMREFADKGIGGFIVFGGAREQVRSFITSVQSSTETPLCIASDIERGVGQQIDGYTLFPCQMAVAAAAGDRKKEHLLRRFLKVVSEEALDVGINTALMPVLDVNTAMDNPIICTRAFSDDPAIVGKLGNIYIEEMQRAGIVCCVKHFPGHGSTSVDSHLVLPVIDKEIDELMRVDVMPFRRAVDAGVGAVMLGHLRIPALDLLPASLSETTIRKLLREELGFEGLIMTDALNMYALREIDAAAVAALNAGVDILLHPEDADETARELVDALRTGLLNEKVVLTASQRVHSMRKQFAGRERMTADNTENERISSRLFQGSITLVKGVPDFLPMKRNDGRVLVLAGDDEMYRQCLLRDHFSSCTDLERSRDISGASVVVAIFTSVRAWKGGSGISDRCKEQVAEIVNRAKESTVISFGSPYVLSHFDDADLLIAAYEAAEKAQKAAIHCLFGASSFQGRLPVSI
jgi:beta-N-acetylhexosaminidase